jgi:peptidyl-prolyl cis-trans isomerase C
MRLRHPAFHILALGLLVAGALLIAKGAPTGEEHRQVLLTAGDLMHLRAAFERTWQREPTPLELRGQLEQYVRQEVLYREALARGYDEDDPAIRQVMQRKMEFLASSQALKTPPSEAEVEAYFALQRERYRLPAVLDLAQVYLDPETPPQTAAEMLERLRRENPPPEDLVHWGDPILLEPVYRNQTEQELSALFGGEVVDEALTAEVGRWVGPIASGYGWHLMKILEREPSRLPELGEVLTRVIGDMEYEASQAAREQLYQEVVQGYQIVFDRSVRDLLESTEE